MMEKLRYGATMIFLLFVSCLDPFTFKEDLDAIQENIVVDGVLSPGTGPYIISLSVPVPFGKRISTPYSGAQIALITPDDGRHVYIEREEGEYYLGEGQVKILEGQVYQVEIKLKDGRVFRSEAQKMPSLVKMDRLRNEFSDERILLDNGRDRLDAVISVLVDFTVDTSNQNSFLRWRVDALYSFAEQVCGPLHSTKTCYVPVDPEQRQLPLFSSSTVQLGPIKDLVIFKRNNLTPTEFKDRHVFSVQQYSISPESYAYWSRVNTLVDQRGTIFDVPPAPLLGNMTNIDDPDDRLLGYFDVVAIDTLRTVVFPSEFKKFSRQVEICNIFNRAAWPAICCECGGIPNASTIRPSWF